MANWGQNIIANVVAEIFICYMKQSKNRFIEIFMDFDIKIENHTKKCQKFAFGIDVLCKAMLWVKDRFSSFSSMIFDGGVSSSTAGGVGQQKDDAMKPPSLVQKSVLESRNRWC